MNWTEIKSTLVRRWPEKFELYEEPGMLVDEPDGCGIQSADAGIPYFATELSDIAAICEAIGQWVWSDPMAAYPQKWWGMWWDREREKARHTPYAYNTRAEAELAALGEWLKATEVDE